jgi:hypothetical protein
MTAFIISSDDDKRFKDAVERAKAHPIPWEVLKTGIPPNQPTDRLTLADREGLPEVSRTREEVMLPLGWRVAITVEEQPAGRLLHLSMSSPKKGKIPNEHAMRMVIEACGFKLDDCARGWLEEFEPGWNALNVLIFLAPPKEERQ